MKHSKEPIIYYMEILKMMYKVSRLALHFELHKILRVRIRLRLRW